MVPILHATMKSGDLLNLADLELVAQLVEITSTVLHLPLLSRHQLPLPFLLPPQLPHPLYLRPPQQRQYQDLVPLDTSNVPDRTRIRLAEMDVMDPLGLVFSTARLD
jgi:hypothetical protein